MIKKVRGLLKNNKGFTLVELLAVIVILGIIAAIAVPSIGNIIENSREDAAVATAQQAVEAARLAVAAGDIVPTKTAVPYNATEEELSPYIDAQPGTGISDLTVTIVNDDDGNTTYTPGGKVVLNDQSYDIIVAGDDDDDEPAGTITASQSTGD